MRAREWTGEAWYAIVWDVPHGERMTSYDLVDDTSHPEPLLGEPCHCQTTYRPTSIESPVNCTRGLGACLHHGQTEQDDAAAKDPRPIIDTFKYSVQSWCGCL